MSVDGARTTGGELGLRGDLDLIIRLVPNRARVLDLGCGDGLLLERLRTEKGVDGRGVERDPRAILGCLRRGIPVFQGDLDEGLADFATRSFDVVIISHTLQQVHRPRTVLLEAARVGRQVIVGFPNFGHWPIRFGLLLSGRMPKSSILPYEWYDTPNIHLLTIADFEEFCAREGLRVEQRLALSFPSWKPVRFLPDLMAAYALYLLDASDVRVPEPASTPDEPKPEQVLTVLE